MLKSFVSLVIIICAVPAIASVSNPAECWTAEDQFLHNHESDGITGYTVHSSWLAAAGATTTVYFESFSSGTIITTQLYSYGISMVTGESGTGVAVDQIVLSSANLPFPMFTPGTLPSEPNFISNDLASPYYGTGSITLELTHNATAIGAYIADGSPLDDFCIEVFDGAVSLGMASVGPRTLPDSFMGIISDDSFDKAVFFAASTTDSWGLDNLELNDSGSALESGTWGAIKAASFQ